MTSPTYHLTATAFARLDQVIRDTARRWGWRQAEIYRDVLLTGFQEIAQNHPALHSPHRAALAQGTGFSLHLVEHHYVCFTVHDTTTVIVTGLFHERMNMPVRRRELQAKSALEIATLHAEIEQQAAAQRRTDSE